MKIIDTHAHIFAEEFEHDLEQVINNAKNIGVEKVLLPNIDCASIDNNLRLSHEYPDFFRSMMGLHPTSVNENWKTALDEIYRVFQTHDFCAIGEIGIDLYWDKKFEKEQIEAFETQLKWSAEQNLPVSIHTRDAIPQVIKSIKKVGCKKLCGVFHSFGGTKEELESILSLKNFYLGINGVVTFKNSGLAETLLHTTVDHLVLETDSPYLAPVPYRGKRNESAFLIEIIRKIASIYAMTEEDVAKITTKNACSVFSLIN